MPKYTNINQLRKVQSKKATGYQLLFCKKLFWSGWQDLNLRPPAPKAGAIPSYATPRKNKKQYGGGRGIRTLGTLASTAV
jgi:hypothetical protein